MPSPPRSGLSSPNPIGIHEFHRKASQTFTTSKRDNGLISPAKSTFSFADEMDPRPPSRMDIMDEGQIERLNSRAGQRDVTMVDRDRASVDLSRKKSQFYSEVFAYREPNLTARDRVHRYSVITAEVKTNVIVSAFDRQCFETISRLIISVPLGQR